MTYVALINRVYSLEKEVAHLPKLLPYSNQSPQTMATPTRCLATLGYMLPVTLLGTWKQNIKHVFLSSFFSNFAIGPTIKCYLFAIAYLPPLLPTTQLFFRFSRTVFFFFFFFFFLLFQYFSFSLKY